MAKRRASGDGMVRKRNGRWEGRMVIGHKENGDPIFRYVYADTQKELTAKLRQNISAYQGVHLIEKSNMTLSQWLDKTLSAIIGHVSSATTLNVYAHVSDEMRQKAADRTDRGIAGVEPPPNPKPNRPAAATPFQAVKGKYRKPGTGCVTQINDHLWEGRYSPKVNGKRMARNIYAPTEAECEEKLAILIAEMKQELAALKARRPAV